MDSTLLICSTVIILALIIWVAHLASGYRYAEGWKDGYHKATTESTDLVRKVVKEAFEQFRLRKGKK